MCTNQKLLHKEEDLGGKIGKAKKTATPFGVAAKLRSCIS